jgi:hypothetical protein
MSARSARRTSAKRVDVFIVAGAARDGRSAGGGGRLFVLHAARSRKIAWRTSTQMLYMARVWAIAVSRKTYFFRPRAEVLFEMRSTRLLI